MMKPLSLAIGRRFSRARQRNRLVSFISLSSVIGIAVGVMVIIVGLSAMNGFERELNQRVLSVVPHGQVFGVNGPIENWQQVQAQSERHPQVEAAAPYVELTALMEHGTRLQPAQIRAVDPTSERTVSRIGDYIDGGWESLPAGQSRLVLGQGIASQLGVSKGDWITVMVPATDSSLNLRAPKRVRMQVAGLLQLGGQIDHSLALMRLQDAQALMGMDEAVTGVSLKVSPVLDARKIVQEVGQTLSTYVYLKDWTGDFGYLYRDIQLVRAIMYLVMVLVIGVACFNVVSTLMMSVKDRAADIAILRTMGANDRLIRRIFIWYGLFSGALGSAIGSVLGVAIASHLTAILSQIEAWVGHRFLSGDVYFVNFLPSELHATDVVLVSITAILLSLLAAWYPARRACQLQPAAVLSAK
ncbi:lipoprotein transporter subunit LolE [Salinivibrio sp. MA351]|uniref:lipoprotein-releasing ABC transporter permease subunit LolE n=1 Tax=Salinivibrio TaxID=51366 RepID=UPI000472891B|nr:MULTISPECIES: lipoprotein-releasing ABC transporter permease subunit LolE [Salinivibrio]NUY55207.1 lipoprotein-releasing ABC transporter permease subunit LolE [Salinivibrio sp. EAGSL]OOE92948.1 lipoprotein transporter subunit LolE [Salinivibrio sp. AR647]OOE99313.1 lipoprotein transporter subunit LolE [Salinivibrio sp. MA351]OOF05589.1 lipoprotein transporter subunit LolE [Salinivibrio sp. MA607]